jgi:NAD(P)-dependent dehydrogenase (short-subunit alcohol dehydrogenase family)
MVALDIDTPRHFLAVKSIQFVNQFFDYAKLGLVFLFVSPGNVVEHDGRDDLGDAPVGAQDTGLHALDVQRLADLDRQVAQQQCIGVAGVVLHLDELDLLLRVNIRGTFLACQQAARRMQSARRGRIVIITSICALQGWAKESVYCLTKAAQQSMVQSLAVELAPFGILVNGIAPGLIEKTGDAMAKTRADPEIHRHDMERTSLGRFGMVEEVAEAVDYLTTVTWTTGQTMVLDGGFMATGLGYFGANRDQVVQRDPGTQSKGVQHED